MVPDRNWLGIMRIQALRLLCAAVILTCCGTGAFAQVTLTLLSPPNTGFTEGGVYTSPYNINVNSGLNNTGTINTPMQLICDDFTTDINVGESWNATVTTITTITTLNTSTVANLKFNADNDILGGSADVVQDYAVAAVLAGELLSLPSTDSQAAGDLSFALWDVFDPALLGPGGTTSDIYATPTNFTYSDWSAAETDLNNAVAEVDGVMTNGSVSLSSLGITNLTIYTPNPTSAAQEFMQVTTPEASTPVLLAVDLLGFFALVAFLRRKQAPKTV